ncbi:MULTISPECIES: acyltransferase domain-containing protein, partial [unclassified Streptomyces]|uniref:acyltransferase domain-containing protein n=1 Tax=unclassified Streptomyces TaxID=2593676 RepID=UPI0016615BB5
MFPGQGDFPLREFTAALARDEALRAAAEEIFDAVDLDGAERGVPELRPWLTGRNPPGIRELADTPVGTGQLALFGVSMSLHTLLVRRYGPPDSVLGVGFGEIAALTAAGALSVREGAEYAHRLARVLATAPGGLTLLACDETAAAVLLAPADTGALATACVHHPGETVVAGPLRELARLEARALAAGIGAVRLRLPFSAHHPALTAQAARFHEAVRFRPPRTPRLPVFSAVAGRAYGPGEDLPRRLADCLIRPVRLPEVLDLLYATGHDTFRETGPGATLTRAAHRLLPPGRTTVTTGLGETPTGAGGEPARREPAGDEPPGDPRAGPARQGSEQAGGAPDVRAASGGPPAPPRPEPTDNAPHSPPAGFRPPTPHRPDPEGGTPHSPPPGPRVPAPHPGP